MEKTKNFFSVFVKDILNLKPSRPMKYPYTLSAKIAQFPYKFHMEKSWMYRYYPLGVLCSIPVFAYISSLANSPENKAKWDAIRRREKEEAKLH